MPRIAQRLASKLWPISLAVMIVFVPFLVKKSYDELKAEKGK